ncbi:F-box/FBD/LRR-repeat protein At1g16930 [Medicago truncatula]|uniref:F-box/FBD/LRR-repeat protein At1g16930 n=1 Tax=Medicago truncatula TaxID=3880 RepID=UPI000D2F4106|nr:F-box/FBD/LRR-repeat protein At1g16930 [Medicago truncatula]
MERQKKSEMHINDDDTNDTNKLSDLPDHLLLHIIEFMNTKQSVQTCVLSKRWKDLWKNRTNLKFLHSYPDKSPTFCKFVSQILSCRDTSIPLHSVHFEHVGHVNPPKTTLLEVMKYAVSHNVQQLTVNAEVKYLRDLELSPYIFSCQSLTFLKLGFWQRYDSNGTMFPKSLNLPSLKILHLLDFTFTTSDNGCAEPFSKCKMLNTLVIISCHLQDDAQALCISNSEVSSLTIGSNNLYVKEDRNYKVVFSTPKLTSLTINGPPSFEAPSASNLPFLEEVYIDYITYYYKPYEGRVMISWLQLLANVKIMKLSSDALDLILLALKMTGSVAIQPPSFVKLKSLKVQFSSESAKIILVEYMQGAQKLAVATENKYKRHR